MLKEPLFPLMKYLTNCVQKDSGIAKTLIIGNVSCDLDSFLSSYLLSLAKSIESSKEGKPNRLYVPIVNCNRGELVHRFDIDFLLERFGIDASSLLYVNDRLVQSAIRKSRVVLVDHNKPDLSQDYLKPLVTEVYDHHQDVKLFDKEKVKKTIITPLGSCSTLILSRFFLPKFPIRFIDPLMSLSAVLVDTENFHPSLYRSKWVDLDKTVYNIIMKQSFPRYTPFEYKKISDDYYKQIFGTKNDVKKNIQLGIKGVMTKDKKQYDWGWFRGGWSALQISLRELLREYIIEDIVKEIEEQCNANDYRLYLLSYSDKMNGKDIKSCVLYNHSLPQEQFTQLIDYIARCLGEKLYEKKIAKHNVILLNVHQALTRKHIEPFINHFFTPAKH